MKRKHSTKRALIASVVSLCLCFSMLIGTTYAWFTDSVTSAGNIIKSGKLDVEMAWADGKADPTATEYTDASAGPIFNYDNWEPGYTEARHIKISNVGTLALKYAVRIIPDGEVSALADVIDVYYADPAVQVTDRALNGLTKLGTLTQVLGAMNTTAAGELAANTNDTITLVLKMQESAGNEYQNMSIGSSFSVQLVATQLMSEEDSFGPDYDKDSQYPEVSIDNATHTKEDDTKITSSESKVDLVIPVEAPAGNYALETSEPSVTTDSEGNSTISLDITLKRDGVKVTDTGVEYTVSVDIGAGLNLISVAHDGVIIPASDYVYDSTTGIITFTTTHFSPFSFTYDLGKKVESAESLADQIAKGGIIQLSGNVELVDAPIVITNSVVLNLNGYTLSGKSTSSTTSYLIEVKNGGELIIQNGTVSFYATTPDIEWGGEGQPAFPGYANNTIKASGTVIVNNAKVENTTAAGGASYAIDAYPDANVVINDGSEIDGCGKNAIRMFANSNTNATNVTINGGIVTGTRAVWVQLPGSNASVAMLANLTVNGGKLISTDETYNLVIYSYSYGNSFAKTNIALNGGSFDGNVAFGGGAKDSVENVSINWAKCTFNGEYGVFRYTADGSQDYVKVTNADELKAAIAAGNIAVLANDIEISANETITIANGKTAYIDLNKNTIVAKSSKTGNVELFLVKGTLNVYNGKITLEASNNQGWSAMTTIFDVTAGGVLNIENSTIENLGGSDMAFCVHLNNWGEVTLNAENTTFTSTYVGIRAFNSGNDMNNISLDGCEVITDGACFWVHNYTSADFGGKLYSGSSAAYDEAKVAARLNLSFVNTEFTRKNSVSAVRYGMTNAIYYADVAMTTVVAGTEAALKWALANDKNVILNNALLDIAVDTTAPYGNKLGISVNGETIDGNNNVLDFNSPTGDNYGIMISEGTIKNVTVGGVFRGIIIMSPTGDIYIDNVIVNDEDVCYALNTAEGDGTRSIYVSNSTLCGWTSIGNVVKDVTFTNCTFGQGTYYNNVFGRLVKPYVDAKFVNCEFGSKFYIDLSALEEGATVVLENCTVNGVKLTAENWTSLIAPEASCGEGQISVELRDGTYLTASNLADYVIIK